MNRILVTAMFGMCLAAAAPWAENPPAPTVGEGYGALVPVTWEMDTGGVDRSYLQVPDTKDCRPGIIPWFASLIWHPDGKHIVFTDRQNIYSLPVEGGKPRLLLDSYYIHTENGVHYVLDQSIQNLAGFSPDGGKLYFSRYLFGEGSGAVITVSEDSSTVKVRIKGTGKPVLQCLDLATGGVTGVLENALDATVSRSGNSLYSFDSGAKVGMIKNLVSGESWNLPFDYTSGVCFTPDDRYLVYSRKIDDGSCQVFRIPVQGGEPQQITSSEAGSSNWYHYSPDCAPTSGWAIYTGRSKDAVKYNFDYGAGQRNGNWFTINVRALNLYSGISFDLLPSSEHINTILGRVSPDGKKICYHTEDYMSPTDNTVRLYIQDISFPDAGPDEQLSVADAAPAGFALTGNHPNPFNPSTHIAFTLPSAGTVQMSVYDVTGRLVRNLVSPALSAGAHELVWDGRDDSGRAVSSGTYIARLKMGNLAASHRMTLVK